MNKTVEVLGHIITPAVVRSIIRQAATVNWGTHLLRWRYFDVTHEDVAHHTGTLIPTALWHLLKRVHVDRDWPPETTLDELNNDARAAIEDPNTAIYAYGYHRTAPPRLQWGFFNSTTGIAVVYDGEGRFDCYCLQTGRRWTIL
jgi:hypothetical protein